MERPSMPRDGDKQKCFYTDCNGTMTYYTKLKVDQNANPPVQPGDTIGTAPDPHSAGWLCDADWHHHRFDNP
jgi:hypothetical protein